MEMLLRELFDRQRFECHNRLAKAVNDVQNAYFGRGHELSDEELELVSAAGDTASANIRINEDKKK